MLIHQEHNKEKGSQKSTLVHHLEFPYTIQEHWVLCPVLGTFSEELLSIFWDTPIYCSTALKRILFFFHIFPFLSIIWLSNTDGSTAEWVAEWPESRRRALDLTFWPLTPWRAFVSHFFCVGAGQEIGPVKMYSVVFGEPGKAREWPPVLWHLLPTSNKGTWLCCHCIMEPHSHAVTDGSNVLSAGLGMEFRDVGQSLLRG